ncbi:MAG: hypothetical protein GTO40_25360, partial [Deltaproteobacteria bacterium]|nr:hypothetical protein [Deltaproteobacteria bacterium]
SNWSPLGSGLSDGVECHVRSIAIDDNGDIYVGGYFNTAGGVSANNIARWDGINWYPLGSGIDYGIYALVVDGDILYAGGYFTVAGGVSANHIAKWNGSNWSSLGSGVNYEARALAVNDGEVYVGGQFLTAGSKPSYYIAKWSGENFIDIYLPLILRNAQ